MATIGLFKVTKDTAVAAKASAETALRQVEIAEAIEAPTVRVARMRIGGMGLTGRDGNPQIPVMPVLVFDLVNGGRSPATVVAFGFDRVVRNGPPSAVREAEPHPIARDIYLMPGERFEFYDLDVPLDLNGEERRHMMIAFEKLWVWGFLESENHLGHRHRQRFFFRVDIDANQTDTLFRLLPLKPPPVA